MFESINTTNGLSNFGDKLPSLEINKFYIMPAHIGPYFFIINL